jgi:hypothetical protein
MTARIGRHTPAPDDDRAGHARTGTHKGGPA